ncbi:peptidoglycan DD-metalloendopeptidase family protein [Alteromonas sp. ASW11-19]|uniref:Peptidoglycan DD-metalloendopeptidase family protein n=1 Tax=Alteromonas salexigens TaxID=2982530 RepID=A0ABT2VKL0_9ALTE|nr:peptidoglycan DD-metalloendopeptidase family protein [Alteromonas salexigens]MCU7552988.1 peptidoglycan DD-metalloendopeptidase family protein [Alteromonas salexigens]
MKFAGGVAYTSILLALLALNGCGSTPPAPVVILDSQPEEDQGYTDSTYQVQKGDTLYAIAWYTGSDYRDIARYNNLSPPYPIYPGQTLRVTPPPKIAKKASSAPKKTGQTTTKVYTNTVDRPKEQAYGESEKIVNSQPLKRAKKPSKSVKKRSTKGFPSKVERWVWPTTGKLVATFSKQESGNKGIDIQAARGTAILAAADGKVVYSGNALRGYGNLIIIKHTDTFLSAYAHNDSVAVKEQQWVTAGQQIATMGNSGTDSVRLHFEVRYRGKSLDPLRYLPAQR